MQKDYTKQEKSGFEVCEKCNGNGWISMIPDNPECEYIKPCPLCEGEGVVDWVRKIMGYCKPKREVTPDMTGQWKIVPAVTNNKFKYFRKE